ncbi:MAG: hypothetical protein HFE74_05235 [Firmicutes bacterium]|jgi:hypothetical protein|nr:hypothetical protein [Bacillota bacterium]
MEIYTLVGKSGTGKSFHAMNLCKKLDIEAIIDDGLFIYKNSVIAGISAKRASTKIGAVKVALFNDDSIRRQVTDAIQLKKPASILILGTSDGMVNKIIQRLGLPELAPDSLRRIKIEDITTEEERRTAHDQRENLGKHVIPAPSMQLKRTFSGYFMDPLRFFRGKDQGAASERTVVRPTYSYMGEYFVAERVVDDIVTCLARLTPSIGRVISVVQSSNADAYKLKIAVKIKRGYPIWESAIAFQEEIEKQIERMTAFNVTEIDLEIRGIN